MAYGAPPLLYEKLLQGEHDASLTHDIGEALLLADRMIVLSSRPAHVVAVMPVKRPRAGRDAAWIAEMRLRVEKARMANALPTGDPT